MTSQRLQIARLVRAEIISAAKGQRTESRRIARHVDSMIDSRLDEQSTIAAAGYGARPMLTAWEHGAASLQYDAESV